MSATWTGGVRMVAWALCAALVSCDRKEEPAKPDPNAKTTTTATASSRATPIPAPTPTPTPTPTDAPMGVLAPTDQLRTIAAAPEGDVATQVKELMTREAKDGRKVLVYIGATWCEPCKRFHASAARGDLDKEFPNLTLLEYDADRDGERLVTANYNTRLIPYFGLPAADGKGTGRHIEGGVKGSVAVEDIAPRLHELLK